MRREVLAASGLAALSAWLFSLPARAAALPIRDAEYPTAECPPAGNARTRCLEVSRPEPLDADAFRHDGLFVRGGFGVSAFRSKVSKADGSTFSTSGEVLVGGTPFRGLVIGGGVIGEGLGTLHPLIAYSAFAQLYPNPANGFNVQILAAFTILEDEPSVMGPLGALGVGYEFFVGRQTSVGAFARVGYARGLADGFQLDAPFASLAVVFTWH